MGSSQARLLALTSRKFDIGRQLQHYALVKDTLTRDMQKVSKNYNEALKQTTLMWSNDGGVNYSNLTYSTLMRPNSSNGNIPILITNSSGKIVIDQKYKEYADLVAPDGKAGGNWDTNENKNTILSKLTGIPVGTLENYDKTTNNVYEAEAAMYAAEDAAEEAKEKATKKLNAEEFAKYWGNVGGHNFSSPTGTIKLGSADKAISNLKTCIDTIAQSMKPYLPESDYAKFETACESYMKIPSDFISQYGKNENTTTNVNSPGTVDIQYSGNNFYLDTEFAILGIMSYYKGGNPDCITKLDGSAVFTIADKGIESEEYLDYLAKVDAYNESKKAYEDAVDVDNVVLDASQENQINFYNMLFTAIAENGWIEDYSVYDQDYLNQMFQNNEYYVTSMTEYVPVCNCDNNGDLTKGTAKYEYNIDLWSNNDNIFAVNTEAIRQAALTDYEYEKSLISAKEKRIDEKMKNLETEQSAIKTMIEGIEKVKNDNIETYFNIFT